MEERLKEIIIEFENFSEKSRKDQYKLKVELEKLAASDRSSFEKEISKIVPSDNSILFEIYESLSLNPSYWIDFIIAEFRRIKKFVEKSELVDQDSTSSPLVALSFFARSEYVGLNKLIHELSFSVKSKSISIVKISMDVLMDVYYIDKEKNGPIKDIIEKQCYSSNENIKEYARIILSEKPINPFLYKTKKLIANNGWLFWAVILIALIGSDHGFTTGFLITGLLLSGALFGYLVLMIVNVLSGTRELSYIYRELVIFIILTSFLFYSLDNKLELIYMFPISLPIILTGLIVMKK